MLQQIFLRTTPFILLVSIIVSVLWKGGKAIDATWMLGALATWLLIDIVIRSRSHTKRIPRLLTLLLTLYCVLTLLSFLYSSVQNYGFDEVIHTVSLSIALLWSMLYIQTITAKQHEKVLHSATKVLYYTFITAVLIGIAVYIWQPVNRFVGTFFDYRFHTDYWPNAWAQACLLFLPLTLWYCYKKFSRNTTRFAFIWLLRSGVLLVALLLTYSRGAMIAALGQLVVLLLLYTFRALPSFSYRKTITMVLGTIAIAALLFVSVNAMRSHYHAVESVKNKITFSAGEGKTSINERAQFWQQSIQLIPSRPVFGYGPYAFRFVQPQLQTHVLATSDHPHNVFLKYALERGVPTSLVFLLLIASIIGTFTYYILTKSSRIPLHSKGLYISLYIGVLGVVAHNLIDYNLQFVGISLFFFIALGILASSCFKVRKGTHSLLYTVVAFVLLAALFRDGLYLIQSSIGRAHLHNGSYEAALPFLEHSTKQWFSRDVHVSAMDAYIHLQRPADALRVFTDYQQVNLYDARAWKLRGDACRQTKDYTCALQAYDTAWKLSPYNDLAPLRWQVETYIDTGDTQAITKMKPLLDTIINDYQFAIKNGVHHIGLSSNVEELVGLLDRVAVLYPKQKAQYSILRAEVMERAKKDRDLVAGRQPGLLW